MAGGSSDRFFVLPAGPRVRLPDLDPDRDFRENRLSSVLLFALACSLAASLLFGLAPAWHASRVDLNGVLKQSAARGGVGAHSNRLRGALVVAEIALSFVLAAGAAVLMRGFIALTETDLGYRPESVLVATAHVPARTRADSWRSPARSHGCRRS
jgi:hypothetical protein